jgi:hypothetical protein
LLASSLLFVATRNAHAGGTAVGLDLNYVNGIEETGVASGTGFNARLGYQFDLAILHLTPEIGGGYHTFSGDRGAKFSQGFVGGRVSILKLLQPGIYAHVGYGHLAGAFGNGDGRSGGTADAGLFLDLTLLPILDIGVHGGYNALLKSENDQAFDSYVVGLHGQLVF